MVRPRLLIFRTVFFRFARFLKVQVLPISWILFVKRRTPRLLIFLNTNSRSSRNPEPTDIALNRIGGPAVSAARLATKQSLTDGAFCERTEKDYPRWTPLKFFKRGA